MTTNTTAQNNTTSTTYEIGTIVHIAPETLLLQRNVRSGKTDPALVRSIKAVGVLQAITAVLTPEGALLVRFGERRTRAAIEAERETVPVYVVGADTTDNEAEIHRIITQRDENTHRAGLTTAEDMASVEQLVAFGLSAAQITKQARIKRADVDTALIVAGSKIARAATERYESLTLDQAAVVADFEADADTVKALIVAAVEGQFDHVAQRARNDRADAQAKADVIVTLEAAGVRIIERTGAGETSLLSHLKISAANTDTPSPADHAQCPGHVAWVASAWVRVDAKGAVVDEPADPDDDADQAAWDAYEDERQMYLDDTRQVQRPVAAYGCESPTTHGHIDRYASTGSSSTKTKAADMNDADRETAKKARTLVIENNKAWVAAETVRHEWLATYALTKTPPKGTGAFLAAALCKDSSVAGSVAGNSLASQWLGIKNSGYGMADLSPAKTATENRAFVVVLVQILGGYEAHLTKDSWRGDGTQSTVGRYLRFIEACGYTLSDVEKYAISKKTA